MKINQLFVKQVDIEVVYELMGCYGLKGFHDKRLFCKNDLIRNKTVEKINNMKSVLEPYYLPCKARLYLNSINEKRAITILKQIVRLYNYHLISKEKNHNNHKMIFYQLLSEDERTVPLHMKKVRMDFVLYFD